MVIVVVLAQIPWSGVNVYVVVAWLFAEGDQVPRILFSELFGGKLNGSPRQIAGI